MADVIDHREMAMQLILDKHYEEAQVHATLYLAQIMLETGNHIGRASKLFVDEADLKADLARLIEAIEVGFVWGDARSHVEVGALMNEIKGRWEL